ncbi:ATP-dependent zinc protease [Vibrio sp. 99-8-1]|uniref:ATP-dependent zinc protease family protein n=1 Tax=Vibrio sp. 99-8-1 TaxID=2607602 RepID=UPI001493D232|nr:ATP-dependent zinc protease [Vibrio sp. 99-8-1]NOI66514.1 ATP-dependent zinc protease [Vibrio sp. 99-8-1]
MRQLAIPFLLVALLSGCVTTSNQQQQLQTAITQSEQNIKQKISKLEQQVNSQNQHLETLENQFSQLKESVETNSDINRRGQAPYSNNVTINNLSQGAISQEGLLLLGEIETVEIDNIPQLFDARVDTGAETSSLNAVDIQHFERDGNKWVKFHLLDKNTNKNEEIWIEAPVIRYAKVRQSSSDSAERRAVVELWVKVGKIHEKAQFTLADRSQMSHAILLGREFIKDIALVDVSKKYLQSVKKQK